MIRDLDHYIFCKNKKQAEIEAWIKKTGFKWNKNLALWSEDGLDMIAKLSLDEDGWFLHGIGVYGRFTDEETPGAIDHWARGGSRKAGRWFVAADPGNAEYLYKRACQYGETWNYLVLVVSAQKKGVQLAELSAVGIESDRPDFLVEFVYKLAKGVVSEAHRKLQELI